MITTAQRKALSELGRMGGAARAKKLSPKRRSEIARKAGKSPKKKRNGKHLADMRRERVRQIVGRRK